MPFWRPEEEREEPSEQPCVEGNTPGTQVVPITLFFNASDTIRGVLDMATCCGFPKIEVPIPAPDNVTDTFTFSLSWDTDLMIFLRNGVVQEFVGAAPGPGQYTVSKPSVTMGTAPFVTDKLLGIYWIS